jgi:hypothetical protein
MVGLGYVVQRYVLRQGRPDAGTAMATAMGHDDTGDVRRRHHLQTVLTEHHCIRRLRSFSTMLSNVARNAVASA